MRLDGLSRLQDKYFFLLSFVTLYILHIRQSNKVYMYLMICDCLGKVSYFFAYIF